MMNYLQVDCTPKFVLLFRETANLISLLNSSYTLTF